MGLPGQKCLSGVQKIWPRWHVRIGQMSGQIGAGQFSQGGVRTRSASLLCMPRYCCNLKCHSTGFSADASSYFPTNDYCDSPFWNKTLPNITLNTSFNETHQQNCVLTEWPPWDCHRWPSGLQIIMHESKKFQVATKMFAQRGKNKVAQESTAC